MEGTPNYEMANANTPQNVTGLKTADSQFLGVTLVNYLLSQGASMTDAIAYDTLDRVANPRVLQTPQGKKYNPNELLLYDKDGAVKTDVSMLFTDEFRQIRDLRNLDGTDNPTLTKNPDTADKGHSRFNSMLSRYSNYIFNHYSPYFSRDNDGTTYRQSASTKQVPKTEYTPLREGLHSDSPHNLKPAYNSIELLAHQLLVNQHAYQGLNSQNNSMTYLAKNDKCEITASEGHTESGVSYLTLSVARQHEELQRYTLMLKYHDSKARKVSEDAEITRGLDELLAGISEREEVGAEEVIAMIQQILTRRKDSDENLALTDVQFKMFEKSIKKQLKVEHHDKFKSVILMFELEKNVRLRQLFIRKSGMDNEPVIEEAKKEVRYDYAPSYLSSIAEYIQKLQKKRNDFTHLAPFKTVHKFPVNMMGGVLGFTYLGENFMGIRDDLYGPELHEVELHEAIHTPDEYETRVLTKWMLDNETKYH